MEPLLFILLGLTLIIALVLICYFYKKGKKDGADAFLDAIISSGFIQKTKDFEYLNKNIQPKGTVFVGDSITQDYNIHEWFKEILCYNRGIGGDTTIGLLDRLDVSVYNLKPKNVVLLMGTNDLELTQDDEQIIASRIEEVTKKILKFDPTIKIFLLSVLPTNYTVDKNTVGKRSIKRIKQLNTYLATIKGVTYVDAFKLLMDDKELLNPEYTIEGLHLSQQGYQVLTEALKPLLLEK